MSDEELTMYVREIKHTMECEGLRPTLQNEQDVVDLLQGKQTWKEIREAILKRNGLLQ